jgi:hypothetical protein
MFKQILFLNWKASRFGLLPLLAAAFALPLLTVQGARIQGGLPETATVRGAQLLESVSFWTQIYPILALAVGTVLALLVWNWDHRVNHVYPLSFPLPRWQYVLLKMLAGGLILLIPVGVFWFGSLLAVGLTDIPDGLRGYPTAITFRFFLASLIFFAVFFALAAGTMRTAVLILIAWILLLFLGETLLPLVGGALKMPRLAGFRFLSWFLTTAQSWPGPFEVFAGNWMLIDV